MNVFQAIVLGIVQGLTEFLPVSSSGHLVLFQKWFGFQEPALMFDTFLHIATLLALVLFFGKRLLSFSFKDWFMVGIATIPAVLAGVFFKDQIEALFANDKWLGLELMITGLINFYTDYRLNSLAIEKTSDQINWWQSLSVGVAQAIAIIPGISRSGSTVAGAVSLGVSREKAFDFSFLVAIPALLGAAVLQGKDILEVGVGQINWGLWCAGGLAALITGFLSLRLLKYMMLRAKFEWFGWYCLVLGAVVMIWK
jgi:undecaprenyl-diphosphatase